MYFIVGIPRMTLRTRRPFFFLAAMFLRKAARASANNVTPDAGNITPTTECLKPVMSCKARIELSTL